MYAKFFGVLWFGGHKLGVVPKAIKYNRMTPELLIDPVLSMNAPRSKISHTFVSGAVPSKKQST